VTTTSPNQQPTGRDPLPRQARPRVRARVEYAGRDRLDFALDQLRRSLLKLARLTPADEGAARSLARILDDAVAELGRLRAAADQALMHSASGQAELRRQLVIARKQLRRAASPRAREIAQRQVDYVSSLLVDQVLEP
jgi:hypothetical protein